MSRIKSVLSRRIFEFWGEVSSFELFMLQGICVDADRGNEWHETLKRFLPPWVTMVTGQTELCCPGLRHVIYCGEGT